VLVLHQVEAAVQELLVRMAGVMLHECKHGRYQRTLRSLLRRRAHICSPVLF
jgi:hypothetical protein